MGEREQRLTLHLHETYRLVGEALAANARGAPCSVRVSLLEARERSVAALREASALCQFAPPPK